MNQLNNQRLTLVANPTSFDLIIPASVEAIIRHLCSVVHDVEWSGTLFYKVEGSLDDGTFKATCLDICVMDIGSGGYTEFKDTADILTYRMEHNLLGGDIYEALIHSHNNMNAFFSGTDSNTLIDEGSDLKHFLSLVVCNAGQYVARITRKLTSKIIADADITYTTNSQYDTYGGKTVVLSTKTEQKHEIQTQEKSVIEYFNAHIIKEEVDSPYSELDKRLREIKNSKSASSSYPWKHGADFDIDNSKSQSLSFKTEKPGTQLTLEGLEGGYKSIEQENEEDAYYDGDDFMDLFINEVVPDDIIKPIACQMLCSCLFANPDAINLVSWTNKLDILYTKRFGDLNDKEVTSRIEVWIQVLVEQLLTCPIDEEYEQSLLAKYDLSNYGDTSLLYELDALYANSLIHFMHTLPESIIKDMIISELENYTPYSYDPTPTK